MARVRALIPLPWLVPAALAAAILPMNAPDAHGAAGRPRMTGARLLAPGADGSAGLLRVAFNTPICFAGTRRGDRVLAVRGYRVGSIARVRKASHLVAWIRPGYSRFAVARDHVRLLRGRRSPWIHDCHGRRSLPGSVTVTSETRAQPAKNSPGASPTSSTTTPGQAGTPDAPWHTLANPIDPTQQTLLPWGTRSQWLQPWRAYLETPPASMLRDAVGINFNVPAQVADPVAALLADSGFRRARIEMPWGAMSYDSPDQIADPSGFDTRLAALKAHGIRPLILLNSNDGDPGPAKLFTAQIVQPVAAGDRSVQVDQATARAVVPGLTGFNGPTGTAAQFLITSISPDGWAQLSQPMPMAVTPGGYRAATLRYQPFAAPFTSLGAANPLFEQTLTGWLRYIGAVTSEAKRVLGSDNFDVEVWNELNFGSNFLFPARYYSPVPAAFLGTGDSTQQILVRTVSYLRDPAHSVPNVGIGNGFANQTPFPSGATSPVGLTAIDKHPYRSIRTFPGDATFDGIRPVDALGNPDGTQDAAAAWHDSFIPNYRALFPEYFLSGIQTEFMERDLSPITTMIGKVAHGRNTMPPGGDKPPQTWITETNIDPSGSGLDTAADKRHLQAKSTLRALSAFVNKGVSALYFYAVANGDWAMLDPNAPGGGETMTSVKRFTAAFAGSPTIAQGRALTLTAVADKANHIQFGGDGTAAHPPLYNRDVVAFLPFQADSHRFVVPTYVMTRDMAKLYNPSAPTTDVTRYDLPPEAYRLTIAGVDAAALQASATDPLTGQSAPVTVVSRSGSTAVVQLNLTDYPRLLVLSDG
jgi:hypothetical protein